MDKYKKASFYSLIAFFVVSNIGTFLELPLITSEREVFIGGKILLNLWLIRLCFLIRKDAYKVSNTLEVGTMMMAFTIHGQFFNPWYLFVYHELIIALSFLFYMPKKIFTSFAVVSCLLYLAMMLWRIDNIHSWMNQNLETDWLISAVAITVVAILSHSFFTSDRNQRDALVRKFGLVGFQTATVVHDVKSMLASPRMNIDILKKKISTSPLAGDSQVQDLLQTIEKQLVSISTSMTGLNQVVALQQQGKEALRLSQIFEEVSAVLNIANRKITLEISGDHEVYSEKSLLKSIIFNVLMNSIQAFRKSAHSSPCIQVHMSAESSTTTHIEIMDNAGGYPPDLLESLRSPHSDQLHAGMGLFLISTGMQSLGGSAMFANGQTGALVRLSFPSRIRRFQFPFLR